MARELVLKTQVAQAYRRLSTADQALFDAALHRFQQYLHTQEAPVGLGIRHLGGRTYEFRVGLALRVVYVRTKEQVILALLGTHGEVRHFLKRQ